MTTLTHPRLREIAAYLDGVRGTLAGIITGTDRAKLVATRAPRVTRTVRPRR